MIYLKDLSTDTIKEVYKLLLTATKKINAISQFALDATLVAKKKDKANMQNLHDTLRFIHHILNKASNDLIFGEFLKDYKVYRDEEDFVLNGKIDKTDNYFITNEGIFVGSLASKYPIVSFKEPFSVNVIDSMSESTAEIMDEFLLAELENRPGTMLVNNVSDKAVKDCCLGGISND